MCYSMGMSERENILQVAPPMTILRIKVSVAQATLAAGIEKAPRASIAYHKKLMGEQA